MCGLCGSFTQKGTVLSRRDRTQRARVLEGLLIANQVRGTDSTGIAAFDYEGKYDLVKDAVAAAKFVNRPEVQHLLRRDVPAFIGHTRQTSMGNDVMAQNAHPFVEGNVIGAHNGIINNYQQIDASVRVDSQAVFRLLNMYPDGYDFAFSKVSGSCALTWWDRREPEALFLVAHSNPLSAAIVPRINTVFWSSVSDHLDMALRIAYGNDVQWMTIKQDTVYRLDANDIYAWQEAHTEFEDDYFPRGGWVYGYNDDDWDNARRVGTNTPNGQIMPVIKATVVDPKVRTLSEEDRYERYWEKALNGSADESVDESDEQRAKRREQMLERLAARDDEVLEGRFGIDDVDNSLMCGYCEKSLGDGGVWDSGLEILLCRPCQKWWDDYGHYVNEKPGSYPLAKA